MSTHQMITRSKTNPPPQVDEYGNISGLIDYNCNETLDKQMLYKEINRLSKGKITLDLLPKKKHKSKIKIEEIENSITSVSITPVSTPKKINKKKTKLSKLNKSKSTGDLGGFLMTYILSKANEQIKKPKKKRKIIKIDKPLIKNLPRWTVIQMSLIL